MAGCPFGAEHDKHTSSNYCVEGRCEWYEPKCPHPVACNRESRCVHPTDSHDEWRTLNAD